MLTFYFNAYSSLGGILAGHGNIAVTRPNNEVFFNKCESHVDIVGDFYVFNPLVGSQLTGILLATHYMKKKLNSYSFIQEL